MSLGRKAADFTTKIYSVATMPNYRKGELTLLQHSNLLRFLLAPFESFIVPVSGINYGIWKAQGKLDLAQVKAGS